jgi:anti-sigma factor RsiW
MTMKCDDLLRALNDYVDGGIEPELCKRFEAHLAGCNPCQIVIDNIRQTITLYKAGEPYELPADFRAELRRSLQDKWKKAFPGPA